MNEKVFHIGFHKTATSSFEYVYESLGYKLFDRIQNQDSLKKYYKTKDVKSLLSIINNHDAFSDNPWFWNDLYLDLDKLDLNCKFVLTTRDSNKWFSSLNKNHINMNEFAKQHLYEGKKPTTNNKEIFINKYESYNASVLKYFNNRKDFIHFSIDEGFSLNSLCEFLGKKPSNKSFPWINKSR